MQDNIEVFELNNKVLQDFDKLMQKHLDKVKVLKIEDDITNSKLFNVIGLCLDIQEIRVKGTVKTDINKIISSISNPQRIETLILNNVKLPTTNSLSKFKNLRVIELKNIKFSNVNEFFETIPFKNLVHEIIMENVDFENNNLEIFSKFNNLKKFKAKNLVNLKFEKSDFLVQNKKLEDVSFKGNKVLFKELKNLTNGKYKKNIDLQIESKSNFKNTIKIKDKKVEISLTSEDIKYIVKNINFALVKNLQIIFEEETSFIEFIRVLKKVEKNIDICLKEISKLTTEEIIILRDVLYVENISIVDKNNEIVDTYKIDDFIKIRESMDKFVDQVPKDISDLEKVLWIYKVLLNNIKYEDALQTFDDEFKKAFINRKCISKGYSQILKNCLNCLNIESLIVEGNVKNTEDTWYWVQVKLEDRWYNLDLALDSKMNKKMKYCLISNDKMAKNYYFESKYVNYCVDNFDYKVILQFWKNDTIIIEEKKSIIQNIIEKLKLLFVSNKGLPEPIEKEENNNDDTK